MREKEVNKSKLGQFSMEYLLMMGFTMLLLIPTVLLFATQSTNIKSDISVSQASNIVIKIADKAEEIYYQGEPSRTTLRIYMPSGIEDIIFSNKDITMYYENDDGAILDISQTIPINISGSINTDKGLHLIQIKSEGDYVNVTEI